MAAGEWRVSRVRTWMTRRFALLRGGERQRRLQSGPQPVTSATIMAESSSPVHLIGGDGSRLVLPRGRSAFIGVGEGYAAAGPATLHRVTVGDLP